MTRGAGDPEAIDWMKVEDEEQESGGRKDGTADRTLRSASCPAEPRWTLSLEVVREGGWQEGQETRRRLIG